MNNRVLSLISLAMKAGKVKSGEFACEEVIRSNNAYLTIIATDASENTKTKFINSSKFYNVTFVEFETKESLGNAIGKDDRSVISILDEGFAKGILKIFEKH